MKLGMVTTDTKYKAWSIAERMMPNNDRDIRKSERAGYDVYVSDAGYICDLGNRLELNFENGDYMNIWIAD